MKKDEIPHLEEQLAWLENVRDGDIDFSDIPEMRCLDGAVRGKFYRPLKQHVTMRLDADILAWFRKHHPKYQTAINAALREYVASRMSVASE